MNTSGYTAEIAEPHLSAAQIFTDIKAELRLVEAEFERQAQSNIQTVSRLGDYLRASGGKRVRPALLILANYAAGGDGARPNSIRMAAVMELLHTATLVHDDIIDNAPQRRNQPSINSRFGNQTAVLMGDWLYMAAFETSLAERSLEILDILTAVTRKMVEGELMQLTMLGRTDVSEEQYFNILQRKTAYLFSACCEIGAILSGAGASVQHQLRDYGINVGTAFQLIDDLLDFTGMDEELLGKPAGVDLLEGKVTLPLIYLLEQQPQAHMAVQTVMREGTYSETSRELILNLAETSGALERARARADKFAEAARDALSKLPGSKYCNALRTIPTFILERDR